MILLRSLNLQLIKNDDRIITYCIKKDERVLLPKTFTFTTNFSEWKFQTIQKHDLRSYTSLHKSRLIWSCMAWVPLPSLTNFSDSSTTFFVDKTQNVKWRSMIIVFFRLYDLLTFLYKTCFSYVHSTGPVVSGRYIINTTCTCPRTLVHNIPNQSIQFIIKQISYEMRGVWVYIITTTDVRVDSW